MPAPQKYKTHRLRDGRIIDALKAIAAEFPNSKSTLQLSFAGKSLTWSVLQTEDHEDIVYIREAESALVESATLTIHEPLQSSIRIGRLDAVDEVTLNIGEKVSNRDSIRLLSIAAMHFPPYERTEALDKLLGNELAEFYRKRDEALLRLESMTQKLIEENESYRRKVDQQLDESRKKLQAEYEIRIEEANAEHAERLSTLEDRQGALDSRTRELDDRDAKHSRRALRQDLKKELAKRAEKFTLSPSTTRKRYFIHGAFLLLIFASAAVVASSMFQVSQAGSVGWFFMVKSAVASLATIAAIIWYVRWNDLWFRRHADEEFDLKRLELDIDRASWIAELIMEWQDKEGKDLPRELLLSLTANLFSAKGEPPCARHPTEDLLSLLLGTAADVNLNLPGIGTVHLDKKGGKQLKRALEERADE
ncbi:hypothetical protein HS125_05605 [bacterium]|nr:hypothetical protein [bacterium]